MTDLSQCIEIDSYLVQGADPRYVRVLWLNSKVDWSIVDSVQVIGRRLELEDNPTPVMMLDVTVVCLS